MVQPQIADGQDASRVTTELAPLLADGWKLDSEHTSQLQKTYHFKTYTKVMDLHTCIGVGAKAKNHHPTMISVSAMQTAPFAMTSLTGLQQAGSLTVHWTTHVPRGLTVKDTAMARYCDEQAQLIGAVAKSQTPKCSPSPASQA